MRKVVIIELVQDFLSGGDAPSDVKGKYHPNIIKEHVHLVWPSVLNKVYKRGLMEGQYDILDPWGRNYGKAIVSGKVALPFAPLHLDDGMGILQVADGMGEDYDPTNVYAPISTTGMGIFGALEAGQTEAVPMYYLEINDGNGINSHNLVIVNKPTATTAVTVKMVVPLDQIDDYAPISVPDEMMNIIFQEVVNTLRQKNTEDRITDNNPET